MNAESRLTLLQGPLVRGEYNNVVRASRDPEALLLAHSTPITQAEARALAAALQREFSPPDHRLVFIANNGRFSYGPKHTTAVRAYADGSPVLSYRTGKPKRRRVYLKDADGKVITQCLVSLPRKTFGPDEGRGLRVGVVLHEYAHLLDWAQRGRTSHDAAFTAVLDRLVAWWGGEGSK